MAPGTKVYTYQEGIEALRNGQDIDYEGVTGATVLKRLPEFVSGQYRRVFMAVDDRMGRRLTTSTGPKCWI